MFEAICSWVQTTFQIRHSEMQPSSHRFLSYDNPIWKPVPGDETSVATPSDRLPNAFVPEAFSSPSEVDVVLARNQIVRHGNVD